MKKMILLILSIIGLNLIILFSSFILSSNASNLMEKLNKKDKVLIIDEVVHRNTYNEVKPFVKSFIEDMKKYNKYNPKIENTKYQFYKGEYSKLASGYFEENVVFINLVRWFDLDYQAKKRLIYHELGHTIYDFAHVSDGVMSYNDLDKINNKQIALFFTSKIETNTERYHFSDNKLIQDFIESSVIEIKNKEALGKELNFEDYFKSLGNLFSSIIGSFILCSMLLFSIMNNLNKLAYICINFNKKK